MAECLQGNFGQSGDKFNQNQDMRVNLVWPSLVFSSHYRVLVLMISWKDVLFPRSLLCERWILIR